MSIYFFKTNAIEELASSKMQRLSHAEIGMVHRLNCYCCAEGSIPESDDELVDLLQLKGKKEIKSLQKVKQIFINHPKENSRLISKSIWEESEKYNNKVEKLRENGRKGGRGTKQMLSKSQANAEQKPSQLELELELERNMYLTSFGNVSSEQAATRPAIHPSQEEVKKEMPSEKKPSIHPSTHSENQTVLPTCDVKNMDGWMGGYIFDDLDEDMKGLLRKPDDCMDTRVLLALIQFGLNPVFVDSLRSNCLWSTRGLWALLESVRLNSAGLRNPAGLLQLLIMGKKEAGPRLAYVVPALKMGGWEYQPEDNSPGEKILRIMQLKEAREKMIRLIPCRENIVGFRPLAAVREA